MKNYCSKCKVRITSHLWIVHDVVYCSASCQRGKEASFEHVLRAIEKMKNIT